MTLVDEEDWAGAIAASVPDGAAGPRAAALLRPRRAAGGDLRSLQALSPAGEDSAEGAAAFALGDVAAPLEGKVRRVARGGPAAEAASIAALRDRLFGSPRATS